MQRTRVDKITAAFLLITVQCFLVQCQENATDSAQVGVGKEEALSGPAVSKIQDGTQVYLTPTGAQPDWDRIKPEEEPKQEEMRKCVPKLDLSAYFNGSSEHHSDNNSPHVATTAPMDPRESFSFSLGDIDMPVAPPSGSINSAIRLLSTIDSQLEPDEPVEGFENLVKFRDNQLFVHGINLSMLNVHLYRDSEPKFALGVTIKNTTLAGQFSYNGAQFLTQSKLAGYFRMTIDNIYLVASSNLTKVALVSESSSTNETLRRPSFALRTNDFKMNITNLGYISIEIFDSKGSIKPTKNYLLKMLQRLLQKTVKRTYYTFENYIRQTLATEAKEAFDCELTRFTPLLNGLAIADTEREPPLTNHSSASGQALNDDLARILNSEIERSQLATVPLPPFEHQQNVLGTGALIQFKNGSLNGLHNLRLIGESRIKLQDGHLFVNSSIGWRNLRPYYNWNLILGSNHSSAPVAKGFVAFNIKAIDFDAVISKGLKAYGSRIVVEQLAIRTLDGPKMDIGGLPGMNRLTRAIVNFFMGRLKQRLVSSIQPVLKQQLERALNKMSFR